jgi:hypothetical protein
MRRIDVKADIKAIRTQINFDKTRMITAHSDRLIGVAISIHFMGSEKSESSETHASSFSIYPVAGLKKPKFSWSHVSPFAVLKSIVIHPFSIVVFMALPIYVKDQGDTCESNGSRAHQVKTQGNSKKALKIIKITAHTNRTIGMAISISFVGLEESESSETCASKLFVFECTVIHLVSIVICFSGYLGMQVMCRYRLTKSCIAEK